MNKSQINENKVTMTGLIDAPVIITHEMYGEPFYESILKIPRESGKCDRIPFVISGRIGGAASLAEGKMIAITGQLRSFNSMENGRYTLNHHVFAESLVTDPMRRVKRCINEVKMDGYICREPAFRVSEFSGRRITSFLMAVNRLFKRTDYISCVCWGRNACYVKNLPVGTHLEVSGRLQERTCIVHLPDHKTCSRHVFDVSIARLNCLKNLDITA